jgi:hypothetical protein
MNDRYDMVQTFAGKLIEGRGSALSDIISLLK